MGTDPKSDLALLKIEADHLIAAKFGNSDELQKGDWVLAFGSPFGYVGSMTHGIVSALGRHNIGILGPMGYENFIQVDAPINPGNSGGPLVNVRGEVVGINTAIASVTGGSQGIGFAIPSNQVKSVFTALRDKGKVTRGYLGIEIDDVSNPRDPSTSALLDTLEYKGKEGVLVRGVGSDSPAHGKLRVGDIITKFNDKGVNNVSELRDNVARTEPGSDVKLGISRDGKTQDVTVKLGEQPESIASLGGRRGPGMQKNQSSAASIGVKLSDLSDDLAKQFGLEDFKDSGGALITAVSAGSRADRVGLKVGDLITKVGKDRVKSAQEAVDALKKVDLSKGVALFVTNKEQSKLVMIPAGEGR